MIAERGQEDWDSEFGRFPRLFRAAETIPGLTWPTVTFKRSMTLYLGKRRVELRHHRPRPHRRRHRRLGAGRQRRVLRRHRRIQVGLLLRRRAFHRLAGDARRASTASRPTRWCRAAAMRWSAPTRLPEGIALTRDFLRDLYEPVKRGVARGASLKECFDEATAAMRPKYGELADLRALPAVQRGARLRRGPGHRHAAHLDRRARPRHVGGAAGLASDQRARQSDGRGARRKRGSETRCKTRQPNQTPHPARRRR